MNAEEEIIELPTVEEISGEEETIEQSDEFQDAVRSAQSGQYDATLFEHWERMFSTAIEETKEVTPFLADGILRQYTWFTFKDLPKYLAARRHNLEAALAVLTSNYPKDREELFEETEEDWKLHRAVYRDIVAGWAVLSNEWAAKWAKIPFDSSHKASSHAAMLDVSAFLLAPHNGLHEYMTGLAGYDWSDEDRDYVDAIVREASDE